MSTSSSKVFDSAAGRGRTEAVVSVNIGVSTNERLVEGIVECFGAKSDSSSSSQGLSPTSN